jgi:hypothetical protein
MITYLLSGIIRDALREFIYSRSRLFESHCKIMIIIGAESMDISPLNKYELFKGRL